MKLIQHPITGWLMNDELESILEGGIEAEIQILSQHLRKGTEENQENPQ
jgi:hypothetical protein